MEERILKYLFDIKSAIEEINGYFNSFPKDFNEYKSNTLLKRAIERDLEIIGEAVSRILKIDPDFPINSARQIIGLRNQIIHAYDNLSDETIWAIINKHIPLIKIEVDKLTKDQA
ncbi:MAG: DUF86 domain-containing protein [Cyclobacteriaceae bacterium]